MTDLGGTSERSRSWASGTARSWRRRCTRVTSSDRRSPRRWCSTRPNGSARRTRTPTASRRSCPTGAHRALALRGRPQPAPARGGLPHARGLLGARGWRDGELSDELFEGSLATYDAFYDALAPRLDALAERGPVRAARRALLQPPPRRRRRARPPGGQPRGQRRHRQPRSRPLRPARRALHGRPARRLARLRPARRPRERRLRGPQPRLVGARPLPPRGLRAGAGVQEDVHGRVDRRARRAAGSATRRRGSRPRCPGCTTSSSG